MKGVVGFDIEFVVRGVGRGRRGREVGEFGGVGVRVRGGGCG